MRSLIPALGAIVLLGAGATASQAAVVAMQNASGTANGNVSGGGAFNGSTINATTGPDYAYNDYFTFFSTRTFDITYSFLTSLSQPTGSGIAPINNPSYGFYSGTYNGAHTLITPITPMQTGASSVFGSYAAAGLAAGSYYFQLSGNTAPNTSSVSDQVSMGVRVSAVPLPASLPMFGAALLALGGVALMRSRKSPTGSGLANTAAI